MEIDYSIEQLIKNSIKDKHRSMFFLVGNDACQTVPVLHHILMKNCENKSTNSVLWCYKKELSCKNNWRPKMKQLQKKVKSGTLSVEKDDPFSLFTVSTAISYCYYHESQKVLGSTYSMCVLQDFEALTPNLLARTIETVEGPGIICFLVKSVSSLTDLYSMTMDVHLRYKTESHNIVTGRFNERFFISLSSCNSCLVLNDKFQLLPISYHWKLVNSAPSKPLASLNESCVKLLELKKKFQDKKDFHAIMSCCKTFDQGNVLSTFIKAMEEKLSLNKVLVLTAARGRGKSAALGLAIASGVSNGLSNIYVTAPSPDNLKTLFEFLKKGFEVLNYQENEDYEFIQTNDENSADTTVTRVNLHRPPPHHTQTIQYIHPSEVMKLGNCELLVIDEAAAIPLTLVQKLIYHHNIRLTLMSSTINGYEGTGRSLSLKLIKDLRNKSSEGEGRELHEVKLDESIRYASGDGVEMWLNKLLCLDSAEDEGPYDGVTPPQHCQLYYVNREALFSHHNSTERFLQSLTSLYVSSHYKNSPNDLQMLADAPAHHLFCLLPPVSNDQVRLPQVLCVIQVCLEGGISKESVEKYSKREKRAAGDLVPWTVSEQFQDFAFPQLSGARIVRIATHALHQGVGYGKRALELLVAYYQRDLLTTTTVAKQKVATDDDDRDEGEGKRRGSVDDHVKKQSGLTSESIAPRDDVPPLLSSLEARPAEKLDYIGVSFGLTHPLLRFWQRGGFLPVYLCQRPNELTGEHSCVMITSLQSDDSRLNDFFDDFRRRFVGLLSYEFSSFEPTTALRVLWRDENKFPNQQQHKQQVTRSEVEKFLSARDLQRLERYAKDGCAYRLILDLLPKIADLLFADKMSAIELKQEQKGILLAIGLQRKSVSTIATEMNRTDSEILLQLRRIVRKVYNHFKKLNNDNNEKQLKNGCSIDDSLTNGKKAVKKSKTKRKHSEVASADGERLGKLCEAIDEASTKKKKVLKTVDGCENLKAQKKKKKLKVVQ